MSRVGLAIVLLMSLLPTPSSADCVILLHGLARRESSFAVMEEVLKLRGYQVVRPGYPSTKAPIEDLVAQTLPGALKKCGSGKVHIVAHSLGGILVRYWLKYDRPEQLGRVVLLGPPNQGSQLVDRLSTWAMFGWLNGPAGEQLKSSGPDSLPRNLGPVDYPVGVIAGNQSLNPFFSTLIEGPDDGKVGVAETYVEGMTDHIVLPVTHTFMMNNPRVIAQSVRFIETGAFDPDLSWSDAIFDLIEGARKSQRGRAVEPK